MADEQTDEGQMPEAQQDNGKLVASEQYATELREEAKEWRLKFQTLEKDLETQKSERERLDAEAKGDYETALKTAQSRVAELEAKAGKAETYEGVINKLLETQRTGIPDNIAALLDKLNPVDQLQWLAENAAAVTATEPKTPAAASFNPPGAKQAETQADRIARLNQSRGVGSPFG